MAIDFNRFPKRLLNEADEPDTSDEPVNEFEGLDLRSAVCFGYSSPKAHSWTQLAENAATVGWKNADIRQLAKDLAVNVERCYHKIAQFKLTNVNDDMTYTVWFDNNKNLWDVEVANSPKAGLLPEQKADFFGSEMFKSIAKRTYFWLVNAKKVYDQTVAQHVESGEMLDVDVVKLEAIIDFINTKHFMDNLRICKYLDIGES